MKETTPEAMPPCFNKWCQRFDDLLKRKAQKAVPGWGEYFTKVYLLRPKIKYNSPHLSRPIKRDNQDGGTISE